MTDDYVREMNPFAQMERQYVYVVQPQPPMPKPGLLAKIVTFVFLSIVGTVAMLLLFGLLVAIL